jgi:hypothetical protein
MTIAEQIRKRRRKMKSKGIMQLRDEKRKSGNMKVTWFGREPDMKEIEKRLRARLFDLQIENDIMGIALQSKPDPSEAVPSCAFQDWGNSSNVITWKWYNFRTVRREARLNRKRVPGRKS